MIGKGGSSQVFKGCLPDGKELAVKILKQSEDVVREFVLEIEIITALSHKNIISLFGFCFEDNRLLLVYDFLSRGSLEENLHGMLIIFSKILALFQSKLLLLYYPILCVLRGKIFSRSKLEL